MTHVTPKRTRMKPASSTKRCKHDVTVRRNQYSPEHRMPASLLFAMRWRKKTAFCRPSTAGSGNVVKYRRIQMMSRQCEAEQQTISRVVIAREEVMQPAFNIARASTPAAPSRSGKNRSRKRRPRVDFFRGPRCNQDWMALESPGAKSLRGHGYLSFIALIHRERAARCEGKCGIHKSALHVYAVLGPLTHRHLRFERDNVLLLCKKCKVKYEQNQPLLVAMLRNQASVGAAVAGSVKTTCTK